MHIFGHYLLYKIHYLYFWVIGEGLVMVKRLIFYGSYHVNDYILVIVLSKNICQIAFLSLGNLSSENISSTLKNQTLISLLFLFKLTKR